MPVVLDGGIDRRAVRRSLTARGVQTSILYPAIHEFAYYRARFPGVSLPHTEAVARRQLTLPLFPHMTDEQLDRVCEAVAEAV
jgi:dTDP-4-amino-4,6-dideoxygalactose transaminase